MERRAPRIYDNEIYKSFGEQPPLFEIQLGYGLIPFVNQADGALLLEEFEYCKNQIDAQYGIPLPHIHLRDNMTLEPLEYSILFRGEEVGKAEAAKLGNYFCMDLGTVGKELDNSNWKQLKEPAYDQACFIIPETEVAKYSKAGYICVTPEKIIGEHLVSIIKKYRTKILDQCMVNKLTEKVRINNPDVFSDVFFTNQFSTSDMKILLNCLLDEEVSIRDMNTILEGIADYISEEKNPLRLAEKVRGRLAYSFIRRYADENKVLHIIRVSQKLSELLAQEVYWPQSCIEHPYFALEPKLRKKVAKLVDECINQLPDSIYPWVFVCVSDLRLPFSEFMHYQVPSAHVIADTELYAVMEELDIQAEGELTLDGE